MLSLRPYEFWFVTGSQHLYGEDALQEVEKNSKDMVKKINKSSEVTVNIIFKQVLTNADDIQKLMLEVNNNENCAGLITWMHTFSLVKMWIAVLNLLKNIYF